LLKTMATMALVDLPGIPSRHDGLSNDTHIIVLWMCFTTLIPSDALTLILQAGPETLITPSNQKHTREPSPMNFDDVILSRRNIRGYKLDRPQKLIAEIIALAMHAPSSVNTQPWNFNVVGDDPLNRIRAGNAEQMITASVARISAAQSAATFSRRNTLRTCALLAAFSLVP
jgi:hypothetical protein